MFLLLLLACRGGDPGSPPPSGGVPDDTHAPQVGPDTSGPVHTGVAVHTGGLAYTVDTAPDSGGAATSCATALAGGGMLPTQQLGPVQEALSAGTGAPTQVAWHATDGEYAVEIVRFDDTGATVSTVPLPFTSDLVPPALGRNGAGEWAVIGELSGSTGRGGWSRPGRRGWRS